MSNTAWKGAITFGLVSVPVKLQLATSPNEITLHQVHDGCGGRIRFKRVCQDGCGEVMYAEVAKGYEQADGQNIILTDADLAGLPLASIKTIAVEQFTKRAEIDSLLFSGKVYYIVPEDIGERAYTLLATALGANLVGVARITMRSRERLAAISRRGSGQLMLELLHYADEIRDPVVEHGNSSVTTAEKRMARELVKAMTGTFSPAEHTDAYRKALTDLVEAKIDGKTPPPVAKVKPASDLADMLSASLSAARTKKGKAA